MAFWRRGGGSTVSPAEKMRDLYRKDMLPLEELTGFHDFHAEKITDAHFEKRPTVLLLGQYSTGKTTFIRHVLGQDYEALLRVGPEAVTKEFQILTYNSETEREDSIRGDLPEPFARLEKLGRKHLAFVKCFRLPSPLLKNIMFIDTPGINFQDYAEGSVLEKLMSEFVPKADKIILFFDITKLDVSTELSFFIKKLSGYNAVGGDRMLKTHVVLNKAGKEKAADVYRVTIQFMLKLGQLIGEGNTLPSVHIGSFFHERLLHGELSEAFRDYEDDLYRSLVQLCEEKDQDLLESLLERARLLKLHACLLDSLRSRAREMSGIFRGPDQDAVLSQLPDIMSALVGDVQNGLTEDDFPDLSKMQEKLAKSNSSLLKLPSLDQKLMSNLQRLIHEGFRDIQREISKQMPQLHSGDPNAGPAHIAPRRWNSAVAERQRSRSPHREEASDVR